MAFRIRFVGDVDRRLKSEIRTWGRWLRRWYGFPVTLEVRFVNRVVLIDEDGATCYLRWWQVASGRPFTTEIAVGSFRQNLKKEGPKVAYPTVVAALGRALKYYYQVIRERPPREDHAENWGDRLLDAYINGSLPPEPWRGAWKVQSTSGRAKSPVRPPNKPMQRAASGRR